MKIKTKKQLNLPQLIEWAWDNDVIDKDLLSDNSTTPLRINIGGEFIFDNDYVYSNNDTFSIEVEEELTEDTVIDNLYKMDEFYEFYSTEYKTIKDVIRHSVFKVKAVYLNDDLTMTLIWRDGKLVE